LRGCCPGSCDARSSDFFALYIAFSVASLWVAPLGGRVAISCASDSPLEVQSWFYCITNRTYVQPELADVLEDAAAAVEAAYPGTETLMLDGSLPFVDGFPLLPHLSHDDGRKADLAFYYRDGKGGYLPGRTKSPKGCLPLKMAPPIAGPNGPRYVGIWAGCNPIGPVGKLMRPAQ
jgi:hypothetical protein